VSRQDDDTVARPRPYVFYGLALDGAEGAAHVLRCLLAEADLLMAVNGWPTIADVREAGATRTTYRA
jgi:lactate 2-monooxygenase